MAHPPPYFFGYGSLVNRGTHAYPDARPAVARGWRRVWRHLDDRAYAVLAAVPVAGCDIHGLIAAVPDADWAALDQREEAYDRVDAAGAVDHDLGAGAAMAIYTIPADKHRVASEQRPVLLSYLDVVVQGFLREFGEDGVQAFFDTTDGWDTPILNDRAAPQYPRAQTLHPDEIAVVDAALDRLGVTIKAA